MKLETIQAICEVANEAEAHAVLDSYWNDLQCLGGRVLPPAFGRPEWRVQVFFPAEGVPKELPLPAGVTRLTIPAALRRIYGILEVVCP